MKIQVRRDSAANWTANNPVLNPGEVGFETDTGRLKVGDGFSTWNTLLSYSRSDESRPFFEIDFSKRPNGNLSLVDDNGKPMVLTYNQGVPQVTNGKFVCVATTNTGNLATYLTSTNLGTNGKRIGVEFTVATNDTGLTALCIALWNQPAYSGTPFPVGRCHAVISPGQTNGFSTWVFWVLDGAGHVIVVDSGLFKPQAYDDTAKWRFDVYIDEDNGNAYLTLPDDSVQIVTAAKVSAAIAATSGWAAGTTLKSLSGQYAMLEHFSSTSGAVTNQAGFPKFSRFWAEPDVAPRSRRAISPSAAAKLVRAATVVDQNYIAPTLVNSWAVVGGQSPVGYKKLSNGLVILRGTISGGTGGTTAFTLPSGYRPAYPMYLPVVTTAGAVSTIAIDQSGNVAPSVTQGAFMNNIIFDTNVS